VVHDYSPSDVDTSFRVHAVAIKAGIGTHIDAPAHCIKGGATVDKLPVAQLLGPCVKIDVRVQVGQNAKYLISAADIVDFETTYGQVQPGSIVLLCTGWDSRWDDAQRYRNNLVFPALSAEAAQLLVVRRVAGVGIDTLSVDRPESGWPAHARLLANGIYIIENVAHLHQVPATGMMALVCPPKFEGATEAPVRLFALKLS
jgi:kynurenine formamidase